MRIAAITCGSMMTLGLLGSPGFADSPAQSDSAADQVPVIGLDANQQAVVKMIPAARYQEALSSAFSSVEDSLVAVLEDHATRIPAQKPSWRLQAVGIGVGLTGQIGLGPIWNMSVSPRLRLVFTNSKSPNYPD